MAVPDRPLTWLRPGIVVLVVLLRCSQHTLIFGPNALGPGAWLRTAQRHPLASYKISSQSCDRI